MLSIFHSIYVLIVIDIPIPKVVILKVIIVITDVTLILVANWETLYAIGTLIGDIYI